MPPTKHVDTPTTIGVSMSGKIHDAADSSGNERAHAERTMAPPASPNPIADVRGRTKDPNYHDQALVLTTAAARGRTKDPTCHDQVLVTATTAACGRTKDPNCHDHTLVTVAICGHTKASTNHDQVLVTARHACEVFFVASDPGCSDGVALMNGVGPTREDACMVDVTTPGGLL
jgi:hypothetical protein